MADAPQEIPEPKVFIDGDSWCALHGDNIQEGVSGFGDTPEEAVDEFKKNWERERGRLHLH